MKINSHVNLGDEIMNWGFEVVHRHSTLSSARLFCHLSTLSFISLYNCNSPIDPPASLEPPLVIITTRRGLMIMAIEQRSESGFIESFSRSQNINFWTRVCNFFALIYSAAALSACHGNFGISRGTHIWVREPLLIKTLLFPDLLWREWNLELPI